MPNSTVCDPNTFNFQSAFALSDSVLFSIYLVMNTYIWPYGSVIWCSIPKIFWALCFYFMHTDRAYDLFVILLSSIFFNWVHTTMSEEILLAVHRGQKGRL